MKGSGNISPSQKVYTYIKEGRKIEAIKILREETGLSLKDAKEFIEKFEAKNLTIKTQSEISESVLDHLRRGSKIEAIHQYRKETGMGLRDSKEMVEKIIEEHPDVKKQLNKVNKEKGKRALIYILIIILIFAGLTFIL